MTDTLVVFDEATTKELEKALSKDRIKTRPGPGKMTLQYLEGWDVIETLNKIFGFGNWATEIISLDEIKGVSIGDDKGKKHNAYFQCRLKLSIQGKVAVIREDVGYGSGENQKSRFDAVQLAGKEATTDALKRCARTLGNQFGLSLYKGGAPSSNGASKSSGKSESRGTGASGIITGKQLDGLTRDLEKQEIPLEQALQFIRQRFNDDDLSSLADMPYDYAKEILGILWDRDNEDAREELLGEIRDTDYDDTEEVPF